MPNVIKYTTGATETGCLRKGNMLIGNNTADYGATFWNGINPPVGGYTIYLNKASGGPSIYCPTNDTQLIDIANQISPTLNYMSNGGNFSNGTFSPFVYDYSDSGGTTQIVDISNDRPYVGSNDTKALELNYNGGRVMDTNGLLTVGRTYTFSFWAKITSGSYFGVSWNNQNGSGETNYWSNGMSLTTSWQRYSQIFTYNAARLYFYFYSRYDISPNNGKALFTGFQLTETSASAGPGLTTAGEAINWFRSQNDKLCVNSNYEGIVTSGLMLNVDAGFRPSISTLPTNTVGNGYGGYYPVWYDLSGNQNDGYLANGPTFSSANGGGIVLDGIDDTYSIAGISLGTSAFTLDCWFKYQTHSLYLPAICFAGDYWSGDGQTGWGFAQNSGQRSYIFGMTQTGNGGGIAVDLGSMVDGTIYNFVGTRTISGTQQILKGYVNGNLVGSVTGNTIFNLSTSTYFPGYNPTVLRPKAYAYTGPPPATLYNIKVYTRDLSASEITQNFNALKGRYGL